MTFVMYALVYLNRIFLAIVYSDSGDYKDRTDIEPAFHEWFKVLDEDFQLKDLDFYVTLGFCSLLLVLDILYSIFVTHRKTYDESVDALKAWYLIPGCFI